jgi:hypothetical protein
VAYNFQTGSKKIKRLTEYENVTQRVLFTIESICRMLKQLQHERLSWHVGYPSGIQTLPGFDQHLPAKCSIYPLLFGAEHYQSLKIALTNV